MKKIVIWLNVLLMIALCVCNYDYLGNREYATKTLCSGLFAALGAVNALYVLMQGGKRLFAVVMAVGLALAMQADIVIGRHFVRGAALFAAGHLCYLAAYCLLKHPQWKDFLWMAAVFIPSALYLMLDPKLRFRPASLQWVCVGYALIISLMTGKAFANFLKERSWLTGVLLAGSVLFFFSDLMLLLYMFRGQKRLFDILCMSLYYPAELLLAHGIFHSAERGAIPPQ